MECQECLNEMEGLGQLIKMGAGAIEVLNSWIIAFDQ